MEKILYTEKGPNNKSYEKGAWKEFAVHNESEIKGFFGEFRFLSNFWPADVELDGDKYENTEVAYQAAKWKKEDREFFRNCKALESVDYNRKNIPNAYSTEEWDVYKVNVMKKLLEQKFDPEKNPGCRSVKFSG